MNNENDKKNSIAWRVVAAILEKYGINSAELLDDTIADEMEKILGSEKV